MDHYPAAIPPRRIPLTGSHRPPKLDPTYPAVEALDEARAWVEGFVRWYNTEHLHSGVRYTTPDDRHSGRDVEILANRRRVYEQARRRNPSRWSRQTRNWDRVEVVRLNPKQSEEIAQEKIAA